MGQFLRKYGDSPESTDGRMKGETMREVSKASLTGDMGSLGRASNKLIKQFNFPFRYGNDEQLIQADHDRMYEWDYQHTTDAFRRHMTTGGMGLPCWVQQHATDAQVIALLKDLFKTDEHYPDVVWTGYRITGTVNRSNGFPVYSLWLFAKRKESKTKVYSGERAPNVSYCECARLHPFLGNPIATPATTEKHDGNSS